MNFDWVFTPNGHLAIAAFLFAVLIIALTWALARDYKRRRDEREAQEWGAADAWAKAIRRDPYPVRLISRAELDGEEERLTATYVPTGAETNPPIDPEPAPYPNPEPKPWPTKVTPMLLDLAPTYLPERALVRWDPARRDDEPYLGMAGMFASDMRDGTPVYPVEDHAAKVFAGLYAKKDYVDAPVSPAAPPPYQARHDADHPRPPAHLIGYNRVAVRTLNEHTGAWPIVVPRELVGSVR